MAEMSFLNCRGTSSKVCSLNERLQTDAVFVSMQAKSITNKVPFVFFQVQFPAGLRPQWGSDDAGYSRRRQESLLLMAGSSQQVFCPHLVNVNNSCQQELKAECCLPASDIMIQLRGQLPVTWFGFLFATSTKSVIFAITRQSLYYLAYEEPEILPLQRRCIYCIYLLSHLKCLEFNGLSVGDEG